MIYEMFEKCLWRNAQSSIIFLYIQNFFIFRFRNPSLLQGYKEIIKNFLLKTLKFCFQPFRFLIDINFYQYVLCGFRQIPYFLLCMYVFVLVLFIQQTVFAHCHPCHLHVSELYSVKSLYPVSILSSLIYNRYCDMISSRAAHVLLSLRISSVLSAPLQVTEEQKQYWDFYIAFTHPLKYFQQLRDIKLIGQRFT